MNVKLTQSIKEDLPVISEIYKTEFSKPPYNENWTDKIMKDKMDFFFDNFDTYTIKYKNEIVGFIVVNPLFMCPGDVAFAEEIAIKKEFQNKGIGTFVWKRIFEIYKNKGFKKVLGIASRDGRAMNLYNRIGLLPSKKGVLLEKKLK